MPKSDSRRAELAKTIAANLRRLRAARAMNQHEVATAVGCHVSAVSRWESGGRLPPATDLLKLAKLYGVSTDELLGRDEIPVLPGAALIHGSLLERLAAADSQREFDDIVALYQGSVWAPVAEGSMILSVPEAMRRTREVADRWPGSTMRDRLFRPGRAVG